MYRGAERLRGSIRAAQVVACAVLLAVMCGFAFLQLRENIWMGRGAADTSASLAPLESAFDRVPTVLVVGDSFAGGTGDPSIEIYPNILARRMGWDLALDAQGGTGFVNARQIPGTIATNRVPFIERLDDDARMYNPDIVIVDGGRNDLTTAPSVVVPAADAYLKKVHALWPNAKVVVIIPSYVSADVPVTYAPVAAGLRSSAAEIGASVIDPVEEGWYRGVELEPMLWLDGIHLSGPGNAYYADKISADLTSMGMAN